MRPTRCVVYLLSGLLLVLVLSGRPAFAVEGQESKADTVEVKTPPPPRPDVLAQAEKQIRAGQAREAETQLRGFLTAYPDSPYVPEAYYLLGQARFRQ